MESAKLSALLVLAMLALSSSSPVDLACNECSSSTPSTGTPVVTVPPVTLPPVTLLPPVSVPPVGVPRVKVPKVKVPKVKVPKVTPPIVSNPPISLPPVTVPPVLGGGSPVTVPPVTMPPVTLPPISVAPVIGGPSPPYSTPPVRHGGRKACPPPPSPPTPTPSPPSPSSDTCPIDALKLGACVDLLGNEVHIGDANVQCCPLVNGVAGLSAAACLCTTIKAKLLDLTVYVPIALKLLVNCGCAVPPGYTCA